MGQGRTQHLFGPTSVPQQIRDLIVFGFLWRIKSIRAIPSLPASVMPVACASLGYPGEAKKPLAIYNPICVLFETW